MNTVEDWIVTALRRHGLSESCIERSLVAIAHQVDYLDGDAMDYFSRPVDQNDNRQWAESVADQAYREWQNHNSPDECSSRN
jgi:hypothetical protein